MKKAHVERAYGFLTEGKHLIANHEQMIAHLRRSGSETLVKKAEGFRRELLKYQARFEAHLARLETAARFGPSMGPP